MSVTWYKLHLVHLILNAKNVMWKTSGNVFLRLQREWESFSYFRNTVLIDSNMIRTHNHLVLKRTLNHSANPVWLNGWVFVYKHCEFKSRCCHLNFRYGTCFEQGVHWHSGNYKVWIHSETQTWHDNNIQTVLNQGGACPPPSWYLLQFLLSCHKTFNDFLFKPYATSKMELLMTKNGNSC